MAKSSGFPAGEDPTPPLESAIAPVVPSDPLETLEVLDEESAAPSGLLGGLRRMLAPPGRRREARPPEGVAAGGVSADEAAVDGAGSEAGHDDHSGQTPAASDQLTAAGLAADFGELVGGAQLESDVAAQSLEQPDGLARFRLGLAGLSPDNAGPGAAAFFDVDNTTIRGSSFVALAKGMADRDYFTTSEIMSITWKQLKFVVSGRENMDDITAATENGLEFVKGRGVAEIQTLSDEVYDEKMVKRLWAGTLALTQAHLAAGHQVWLVSATPREVAEVIAARLGLTGGLGTVAEVKDGRYTGRLSGLPLHGQVKADVVADLAATHGLDLARCSAYSDSANDIPMLSVVGFPVAINPDGRLRAHARANGWPIRDYRIRGKESVRKGVPAAASAGLIAGAAVGVAKGIATLRGRAGA